MGQVGRLGPSPYGSWAKSIGPSFIPGFIFLVRSSKNMDQSGLAHRAEPIIPFLLYINMIWIVFKSSTDGFLRPCLVGRKFFVFCIQTFRKQGKRV